MLTVTFKHTVDSGKSDFVLHNGILDNNQRVRDAVQRCNRQQQNHKRSKVTSCKAASFDDVFYRREV